jgi:hypothetical protein
LNKPVTLAIFAVMPLRSNFDNVRITVRQFLGPNFPSSFVTVRMNTLLGETLLQHISFQAKFMA